MLYVCTCVCVCVCVCVYVYIYIYIYIYSTCIVEHSIHIYTYTPSLKAVAPTVFIVGLQHLAPYYGFHLQFTSGYNHHDL
jgi:hypothetical protein